MKFFLALICLLACPVLAQTTQPAGDLELRAQQSFNRGEYAAALPLLQKLAGDLKDQPQRLPAVQEQIRVCERNLVNPDAALAATPASEPRVPHAKPKDGEIVDLTIKQLGNFDYDGDKGGNIPKDVQDLTGSKIRLHGFMIPIGQTARITRFALVPSLFSCCFGQPPQVQHTIVVACPDGKAVAYFPDEISVEGMLKVEEKKDDGYIVSVFEMDAASVKPAAK